MPYKFTILLESPCSTLFVFLPTPFLFFPQPGRSICASQAAVAAFTMLLNYACVLYVVCESLSLSLSLWTSRKKRYEILKYRVQGFCAFVYVCFSYLLTSCVVNILILWYFLSPPQTVTRKIKQTLVFVPKWKSTRINMCATIYFCNK